MLAISVVMPLYNKENFVRRAIESVLQQTFREFELLVVDDGSTDGSKSIAESYTDPRIRILSQANGGVAAARNSGIREATGSLIAFLDADDQWLPGFLAHIDQMQQAYPEAGMFATAYEIRLTDGTIQYPQIVNNADHYRMGKAIRYFRVAARAQSGPACSSALAVRSEVFGEIGVFATGESLGEDIDMWGRIALQYPVIWSSYVGAVYWQEDAGSASKAIIPRQEMPFVQTARKFLAADGARSPESREDLLEYITFLQIILARQCVTVGNRGLAIKLLLAADTTLLQWRSKLWWLMLASLPRWLFVWSRHIKRQVATKGS